MDVMGRLPFGRRNGHERWMRGDVGLDERPCLRDRVGLTAAYTLLASIRSFWCEGVASTLS